MNQGCLTRRDHVDDDRPLYEDGRLRILLEGQRVLAESDASLREKLIAVGLAWVFIPAGPFVVGISVTVLMVDGWGAFLPALIPTVLFCWMSVIALIVLLKTVFPRRLTADHVSFVGRFRHIPRRDVNFTLGEVSNVYLCAIPGKWGFDCLLGVSLRHRARPLVLRVTHLGAREVGDAIAALEQPARILAELLHRPILTPDVADPRWVLHIP